MTKKKTALVLGAAGFIGGHLVQRLIADGYWVRGVDIQEWDKPCLNRPNEFMRLDLRDKNHASRAMFGNWQHSEDDYEGSFDEVYQLAADMGGAGYVFTGDHDFDIMYNSGQINMHVAYFGIKFRVKKLFYSSSACMYPGAIQELPNHPGLKESDAYPADPDSEYGWEKLYSERLFLAAHKNAGLNVRIARFHNIYGPEGTWFGGKEKAPAAMIVKALRGIEWGYMDVWGTGRQTRSFLYIDDCIEAVRRLMDSEHGEPINIGSEESITINDLARIAIALTGENIEIRNIDGPVGVNGRNSDNTVVRRVLKWEPQVDLVKGMGLTYNWIKQQYNADRLKKIG